MKSPVIHILGALLVCAASLAGYAWWYGVISEKSAAVADLQNQIDAKTETKGRISAARAALAGVLGDEAAIQDYFVSETGVVAFIGTLEAEGKAQGAKVNVLSVSATGSSSRPSLTFLLSVRGTFDAVLRAIGAIEYAPYAVSLSALSVRRDAEGSGWQASLTLVASSIAASAAASVTP